MFKKQLIAVLVFGLLSAALIGYSVVNVSGQSSSFENSGYVHVSASDNSNKRILFNSGTTYKKKVGNVISFSDSTGEQSKVDVNNFIHYDDSSISSFVEGVLVDLDALSTNTAIDHYALAPNTVLSQSGTSYTILNSSENYSFKNVIWKLSEDKYLLVSPSMKLRIGEDDERDISAYAEISYVGDSLVQIQTEDNVWQTISDNAHMFIDNGLDIDLSKRAIQSAASGEEGENVLLDFSRIVIDGEDNVEISPLVGTRNGESIIPHFNITAEDGADGINGTAGNNGAAGGSGDSGTNGNPGDDGHDGDKGAAGDTIDGDIKDFPVFTILNWTLDNTSCSGSIRVKEKLDPILDDDGHATGEVETSMLAYYNQATDLGPGSIKIQDLSTGKTINPTSVSGDAGKTLDERFCDILNSEDQTINFTFNGLEPDHSYLLLVDAITSYDNGVTLYLRPYISKTFWTDSLGIYAEAAHSTETSIGFDVVGLAGSGITSGSKIGFAVFDDYSKAAAATKSSLSGAISGNSAIAGGAFTKAAGETNYRSTNSYTTEGGLDINKTYYVRVLYNIDGAGSYDGIIDQILEVPTLKPKAYIGTPILRENQNIFGFNIDPGIIRDEYSSFVNYSYEFYAYKTQKNSDGTDKKDAAGNILLDINTAAGPLKAVTTKVHDTLSVSVGGELRRGIQYCVRTVATFYDNEKYYTLTSDFSNPAMLAQSVKPFMYFVGNSGVSQDVTVNVVAKGTYGTGNKYFIQGGYDSIPVGNRYVFAPDVQDIADYLNGTDLSKEVISTMFKMGASDSIWLRSAGTGNSGYVWHIDGSDGRLRNGYVYYGYAVRPVFNINLSTLTFEGNKTKGEVIKIKNVFTSDPDTQYEFRILSINGNNAKLLALFNASDSQKFDPTAPYSNTYEGSDLDTYLNTTWYGTLSSVMKNAIASTNISQNTYKWNNGTSEGLSGELITGTNVQVDDYDNIHGRIVIQPGDGGSYLGLPRTGDSINTPTIVIKKDGYYYAQYPVYYSENASTALHPGEENAYMLATVDSDNVVTIHLNDPLDTLYTANSKIKTIGGTQPTTIGDDGNPKPSTYEITLVGDIVDGTTISSNVQIGRCEITVGKATPILATFSIKDENKDDVTKPLKDVALKLTAYPKAGLSAAEQNARDYNFEREKGSITTTTTTVGDETVDTLTTEIPGTIKSITIDLFGKIVDEKFLEEVTTYLEEGDEGYDDAANPEHIKERYEYPDSSSGLLASRTLYRSNPEDDEIINKMFSGTGYILTERFFFPDTVRYSDDAIKEIFANHQELTVYVKEAVDYAYGKDSETSSETSFEGVQDKYSNINAEGKKLNSSTNKYFYANVFRAGNPSSNPNILLINKFDFNGTNRRACYISQTASINPISDSVFEKFTYKSDEQGQTISINAKASYNNNMKTLYSVTYYVYDAVDFYAGDRISVNAFGDVRGAQVATSYNYDAPYNNGTLKTYNANKDITEWFDTANPSKTSTYATPVHLDGLELAKITLKINYPIDTDDHDDEDNNIPEAPEVKFIPMTREAYADEHYAGDTTRIPQIDPSSSANNPEYLFFLGDRVKDDGSLDTTFKIDHFSDPAKNAQLYESNGHQYVVVWTAQCKIQDTGAQLVYPFDAVVYASEDYYTEAPYTDASKYPYDLFATELENDLIKGCTPLSSIPYVTENNNAKFGNNAYMLIPHSTISQNNYCLDMERLAPKVRSILFDSDSSTDSPKMTFRISLYDTDKAVIRKSADPTNAEYKKALYYRTNGSGFYTNNITGDLLVSTEQPYALDVEEMKEMLERTAAHVSEITVTKESSASTNTTSAVVAVQRYNDKYTINGAGAHASADAGYVTKSDDNNWTMQNNSNKSVLKKYAELFTTEFNGAEKDNESKLQGYFSSERAVNEPLEAKFYWIENSTQQIDKAVMTIEGPKDIMQRAAGFRIYFEKGDGSFYVDKLLPTMDKPDAIEGGREFLQFEKINEGQANERLRIRFNISLNLEIIKIGVNPDKRVKGGSSREIVTHDYPNFNGQKNIKVSYDILYPSTKAGYKYLYNTFSVSNSTYYSDETFSLKQLSMTAPGDGQYVSTVSRRDYLALNTNFNSTLTYSTSAGYSDDSLNMLGSFFYLRLNRNSQSQPSLAVESTRFWTTSNTNPMMASRTLTTEVNSSSSTVNTMTHLIPVLTGTINNGGEHLLVNSYEFPCLPYTDDPTTVEQQLRIGAPGEDKEKSTIDTPKANPYVGYSTGKSTVDSIATKIGYVEMEDDGVVYFTLSQKVSNNFFAHGDIIKLYKLTNLSGEDGEYETGYVRYGDIKEVNMSTENRINHDTPAPDLPNFGTGGEYAGLSDYFMPINMADQETSAGTYETILKFAELASDKEYSIICWRFANTQSGKLLIPAEMIDSTGARANNHFDIRTKTLPKPQPFTLTFTQPTDINKKLIYKDFRVSDLPNADEDSRAMDGYYTLIEIQDNEGEFVTYLSLIDTETTENETFDADGVYIDGSEDPNDINFIYKYNRNELSAGALGSINNRPLCDEIEYGAAYNVIFRTYRKNEGPAYMSDDELASYDWENDPDSIFVDRTTIGYADYINKTPSKTFKPANILESVGSIVPQTNLSTKAESYFSFVVGGLNVGSGSTRNMAVLPIAIWEHLSDDGETTEYYDVTRFLEYRSDSTSGKGNDGQPHALEKGGILRLDFATIEIDADGNEYSKQIFAKDENIHVFLYSRQLGMPVGITENSGLVTGCVLGEEALKNSKRYTKALNINTADYFDGRTGFEPFYSTSDLDPKSKQITQEQFAALSTGYYIQDGSVSSYDVGSRLLRSAVVRTQDTDITVGKVNVIPVKAGEAINGFTIEFTDYKLVNEIDYMTYELIYHTKYEEEVTDATGATNTIIKDYEYHNNGTRGVVTKDLDFGLTADNQEGKSGKFGYYVEVSSFINNIKAQLGSGGRTNEEDCRLEVVLQFFVESEDGEDLPVSFSRASEDKMWRAQILIDDDNVTTEGEIFNKKLECNFYFNDLAEAKDTVNWKDYETGQEGWFEPENGIRRNPNLDTSPLMNLLNNLNNFAGDLLNNLFGGDNNGK